MSEERTLEQKVCDCILQQTTDTIEVGGQRYELAPPTPATLIMLSALISHLPPMTASENNMMIEVLGKAKDFSVLGRICAVFIIGAKRAKENRLLTITETEYVERWSWKKFRKVAQPKKRTTTVNELEWLADRILDEVTNETLVRIVAKRLAMLQIPDFFALTTSLSEANQTRATREVETVSGAR